jgi:hypothetical protein
MKSEEKLFEILSKYKALNTQLKTLADECNKANPSSGDVLLGVALQLENITNETLKNFKRIKSVINGEQKYNTTLKSFIKEAEKLSDYKTRKEIRERRKRL